MIVRGRPPLIVHVVHRFAIGGLENGIVTLINHLPSEQFRHAIVCVADASDFASRIRRNDVTIVQLRKSPGRSFHIHKRFFDTFRLLAPDVVHTRNFGTFDAQFAAAVARVPVRVHGEHGWDVDDPSGTNRRNVVLRRMASPFVHRFVALSAHIENYLRQRVGIGGERITRICNGVDCDYFRPDPARRAAFPHAPFRDPQLILIGTVGRLEPVKDQITLARAFVQLIQREPAWRSRLRLAVIGDGSIRKEIEKILREANASELAWISGERADVPQLLPAFDVFVLPSIAEGISNTILEAMASGLPVIATEVGGNVELVDEQVTGLLVPPAATQPLADAIARLAGSASDRLRMGVAGRHAAENQFSLKEMLHRYQTLYERELEARSRHSMGATDRASAVTE